MRELIHTAAELDALPVGSVVLDLGPDGSLENAPVVCCKAAAGDWTLMGEGDAEERRWFSTDIARVSPEAGNVLVCVHRPWGIVHEAATHVAPTAVHSRNDLALLLMRHRPSDETSRRHGHFRCTCGQELATTADWWHVFSAHLANVITENRSEKEAP